MLHRFLDDSFPAEVRHRITVLTVARTMSNGCFRFAAPFLATIASSNGTNLAGIGVAVAISELSGLLSPFNGEIVERLNRRTAMTIGLLGVAVGTTIAAASVQPWMFAIGLVVLAQFKVMFDLGLGAWTSDRVPYAQRGRVMGLTETSWAFGLLLGVTTMGLVTAATNWRVGYGLGAAAVLCMAGVVARSIATDSGAHTSADRPARAPVQYRELAVLLVAMFCLMAASQALFVTFGSWLDDSFGFTPATLSLVAFCMGFGEFTASITSARRTDVWGKERSAATGAAIMVPAGLGVALFHDRLWLALPLLLLAVAAFEFAIVSSIPLSSAAVPGSPARGMALMMGTGTVGRATVSVLGTWLYTRHGMAWPALLCAALASITVIALWRLEQRRRSALAC